MLAIVLVFEGLRKHPIAFKPPLHKVAITIGAGLAGAFISYFLSSAFPPLPGKSLPLSYEPDITYSLEKAAQTFAKSTELPQSGELQYHTGLLIEKEVIGLEHSIQQKQEDRE